jgi:flagellar motor component MotA
MEVQIGEQMYDIMLMTVQDYVNNAIEGKLDMEHDVKEYFESAVELLAERSNIPRDVLETLTNKQMDALLMTLQGIDPATIEFGDCGKK